MYSKEKTKKFTYLTFKSIRPARETTEFERESLIAGNKVNTTKKNLEVEKERLKIKLLLPKKTTQHQHNIFSI